MQYFLDFQEAASLNEVGNLVGPQIAYPFSRPRLLAGAESLLIMCRPVFEAVTILFSLESSFWYMGTQQRPEGLTGTAEKPRRNHGERPATGTERSGPPCWPLAGL